jgi:hypothetical protein
MASNYLDLNLGLQNLKLRDTDGVGIGIDRRARSSPAHRYATLAFRAWRQTAAAHVT